MNKFLMTPEIDVKFLTFSDGAEHVQINPGTLFNSHELHVTLTSSQDVWRFFMFLDALNQCYLDDNHKANLSVNLVYMPYARQDRYCAKGQSHGLNLFLFTLSNLVDNLKNMNVIFEIDDVHSEVSKNLAETYNLDINFHEQIDIIKQDELLNSIVESSDMIVAPDKGALEKSKKLAKEYDIYHVVPTDKTRNPETGYIESIVLDGVDFKSNVFKYAEDDYEEIVSNRLLEKFQGRNLLITDDILDGGMTFKLLGEELQKYNPASITLIITHGIISKGIDSLRDIFDNVIIINSLNHEIESDDFLTIQNYI